MKDIPTEDLFDYIDRRLVEKPGFCTSWSTALKYGIPNYEDWETRHATPALIQQGFKAILWHYGKSYSFGPLIRYAVCQRKENGKWVTRHLMYG